MEETIGHIVSSREKRKRNRNHKLEGTGAWGKKDMRACGATCTPTEKWYEKNKMGHTLK